MRIHKLTTAAQHLNAALGSGRFNDIGYDDVVNRIVDGSIFQFLRDRLQMMVTLSLLGPADRLELLMEWEDMIGCIDRFRFDGHKNGLCLLIGFLLEGIARRSYSSRHRLTDEEATHEANVRTHL